MIPATRVSNRRCVKRSRPASVSAPSTAAVNAWPAPVSISRRWRANRSARTPAGAPTKKSGRARIPRARPTKNGELVSSSASQPSTTTSPIVPTAFRPMELARQRKSRSRKRESWTMVMVWAGEHDRRRTLRRCQGAGEPRRRRLYSAPMAHETRPAAGVVEDRVIPAGEWWARVIPRGHTLRIVDLEGQQAVDFLCYNAANPEERYNAADTMKYAKTIFVTRGHGIYSDLGRRLLTIVEDTCGRHDTIGGCCSAESNELRYGVKDTPSCRANFLRALAPFGLGKKDVVANLNFFMNVPVEPDGAMAIVDGLSKPGDYVDLRA